MPEKVLFKTGRIHGFSNRNAADDAEAVWRSHKKKSAKNYSLDRQTTSSQIGEIKGVKRNCFLKNLRIVCRFFRMSFFCACLGISPQRCSACPHRGGRGRIISHSDGHSVLENQFYCNFDLQIHYSCVLTRRQHFCIMLFVVI